MGSSPRDVFVLTFTLLLFVTAFAAHGRETCIVEMTNSTGTYKTRQLCPIGCCRDSENNTKCCWYPHVTVGIVLGITIVTGLVVLACCIYVHIKTATSFKPPRTSRPGPTGETDPAPNPGAIPQDNEPPPPYWMCVDGTPPPSDSSRPSPPLTFPDHTPSVQDCPPYDDLPTPPSSPLEVHVHPAHPQPITLFSGHESTDSAHVTSSDFNTTSGQLPATDPGRGLSQGLVLQPASLLNSSQTPSRELGPLPRGEERCQISFSPAVNLNDGSMIIFFPGQLPNDVRQSVLEAGEAYTVHCSEGSDRTAPLPAAGLDVADVLPEIVTACSETASPAGAPTGQERHERILPSAGPGVSTMSEILKQLPPGTLVVYENGASTFRNPEN